jgi:gliding motility-associated-like protein
MYMNITNPPEKCVSVDITSTSVTVGNSSDLTYSYWKDANASIVLPDPKHITVDGTYYIKGRSSSGCTLTRPVQVTITKLPAISVIQPQTVLFPTAVDITGTYIKQPDLIYSYWTNPEATVPLKAPNRIRFSGTFYIKAVRSDGCSVVTPVKVNVTLPDFFIPNTFTPNGDGINDEFTVVAGTNYTVKSFKIFNRWGQIVYETSDITRYWDGLKENTRVPEGVYFWIIEGLHNVEHFKKSGHVTVLR